MSELITVEKLNSVAFYQIPQAFYYHPKYAGMSGSARETYAILRNLLGLSVKSGWVNEKGEIFVKISRERLMSRLGIKKDKMSSVFKELRELELIMEKRIGCNKCNEIYIYNAKELNEHYLESDLLEEVSEDKSEGGSSGTSFGKRENRIAEEDKTEVQVAEKPTHNKNTFIKNHEDKAKATLLPVVSEVVLAEGNLIDREVLSEFHRSFGMGKVSMKAQEVIRMFLNRFEHSVVLYAFELAGVKNKSFDYAQGILRKWWQAEAFSFDEVFAYEERYSSGV
ncbi:replication initiator protein A [Cellulosilyticum sp. ST5]|uniref:replication initiator protein A n=1 Tax=Cellulosilyticum sp. ST5 TaxID=3055805 RepID=UPI003977CD07